MNKFAGPVMLAWLALATASAANYDESSPLQGTLIESIDAGTYSYLRLKTDDGEVWAATMRTQAPKGTWVVIRDPMLMTNFEAKSLNRTFPRIYFGSKADTAGASSPAAAHAAVHEQRPQASDVKVARVAKATGPTGRTVDEVFSQRRQLGGKKVAVRGTVVKFSAGIMNRNWVHLRDGSGSSKDATNDLLVTTKQTVKAGDVVLAQGVARTDADFGAGYTYPIVLEGAMLTK